MKYYIEQFSDEQKLYKTLVDIVNQDNSAIVLINKKSYRESQEAIQLMASRLGIPTFETVNLWEHEDINIIGNL
jgi:PHD/YefM family antitoxin component YafN of YafNO toxin-antitoxin module